MKDGYTQMDLGDAVRLIREITGEVIATNALMWADYSEAEKVLVYEDENETLWKLNCCTGMSCHRNIRSTNGKGSWSKWEYRRK